jgi:hypothetical protein
VTVACGFDAVLIAPLSVRQQTDHAKIAGWRHAKGDATSILVEPDGLSDAILMGIHSVRSWLAALSSNWTGAEEDHSSAPIATLNIWTYKNKYQHNVLVYFHNKNIYFNINK